MTRIQSFESVSNRKSSFGSDLEQIFSMMRNATSSSMLLIDEFGGFLETLLMRVVGGTVCKFQPSSWTNFSVFAS